MPSTIPTGPLPEPQGESWFEREQEMRTLLVGAGLSEIITYTMTSRTRMVNLLAQADAASARVLLQAPIGKATNGAYNGAVAPASTSRAVATFA